MLSKHQIYLLEATTAVIATLDAVQEYHHRVNSDPMSCSYTVRRTQAAFRHRKTAFISTDLRLKSLEKRTQNIINFVVQPCHPSRLQNYESRQQFNENDCCHDIAVPAVHSCCGTSQCHIFSRTEFDNVRASSRHRSSTGEIRKDSSTYLVISGGCGSLLFL